MAVPTVVGGGRHDGNHNPGVTPHPTREFLVVDAGLQRGVTKLTTTIG
jgi:hypothetical protein